MPGVAYRVGERGPETFVPNAAGNIMANGGGLHFHGPIYVTAPNVRQFLAELQRVAKTSSAQTRGRYGGQNLAFN
jgi:hypothetical protein